MLSGGEVGEQTAVQLGPVVGEAVFAAGGGAITDVLDTARGLEIVKVHGVTEAKVVSLEDATDEIARELVAKDGVDKFGDELAETLRAAWAADGAPPADVLAQHGLSLSEPPMTSKAEPKLLGASDATSFVAAIKTATGEGVLDKVYQADDARVIGAIREYKKADLATWEQQKDMFMGIYARGRTQDFVQRWRKDAVARATVTDRKAFR